MQLSIPVGLDGPTYKMVSRGGSLTKTLHHEERGITEAALAESNGKAVGPDGAAAKLAISRSTLCARIKTHYSVDRPERGNLAIFVTAFAVVKR